LNADDAATLFDEHNADRARYRARVVFDSTFSGPAHARRLVDEALKADWPITVVHIDRRLEDAFLSMLERSRGEERMVGIEQMIHAHQGAAETAHSARGMREGLIACAI